MNFEDSRSSGNNHDRTPETIHAAKRRGRPMLDGTLKIGLKEAAERLETSAERFIVLFQRGDFSAEFYVPHEMDMQQPHEQDEVYLVAKGSGTFLRGEERVGFVKGDFLFIPAGVVHRFEQFSKDFATWVIFFGPRGGSANTE
jgi:mannose-6-phosphate isomerase-like protein (cupin superfamily)